MRSLSYLQTQVLEQVRERERVSLSASQVELLEQVKTALMGPQPPRFVPKNQEEPPKGRMRLINEKVLEIWEVQTCPIPKDMPLGMPPITGYMVRQFPVSMDNATCNCVGKVKLNTDMVHEACGRRRVNTKAYWDEENQRTISLPEKIKTLHIQVDEDALYNAFYPTIPGNDVITFDRKKMLAQSKDIRKQTDRQKLAIWQGDDVMYSRTDTEDTKKIGVRQPNGEVKPMYKGKGVLMRGGKRITGGRREYRETVKNLGLIEFDNGVQKDWDRVKKDREDKILGKMKELERKVEGQLRELAPED